MEPRSRNPKKLGWTRGGPSHGENNRLPCIAGLLQLGPKCGWDRTVKTRGADPLWRVTWEHHSHTGQAKQLHWTVASEATRKKLVSFFSCCGPSYQGPNRA
ncbi:hypothetical protein D8674_010928 [Pyrus ussuriensis x Pyrus communis]|uniref:Uncharacterized protein n=1 Tax=Pyrus ussuriensis x Pyrus communis TaxID=2448454 RepID=A0A5N5G251_9ROSA|nr:hypothetical protein D8674_010928 [Pyrus ussuriensis x Pyrus communis]